MFTFPEIEILFVVMDGVCPPLEKESMLFNELLLLLLLLFVGGPWLYEGLA
jgi:hypothetical protein